jgi:hypothetical protein
MQAKLCDLGGKTPITLYAEIIVVLMFGSRADGRGEVNAGETRRYKESSWFRFGGRRNECLV